MQKSETHFGEDPSPALLAARERSRIAEERLRQHLLAGGSTGSFKQAQPAEIAQSIPEQTYKSFEAGSMGSNQPPSGGSRYAGRTFSGSGADAVQLAKAYAQGYDSQQGGSRGGQGSGGSSQSYQPQQPQYRNTEPRSSSPDQYRQGPQQYHQGGQQYNQGGQQYDQGGQQYNQGGQQQGQRGQQYDFEDEAPPPVRQYPRGGSLHPSAYGGNQGGDSSRDAPSDRTQGDRFTQMTQGRNGGQPPQQSAGPNRPTASPQVGGNGGSAGPFSAASQDGFPDNTDSEASDAESVRLALAHARLRSQELAMQQGVAHAPTTGTPTAGQGGVESSTDTTYYDEEISLAPSDSLRDPASIGDDEDSLGMALRHAREASKAQDHPTASTGQPLSSVPKRKGAPTNYAAMQIYNAMPTSVVEKNPAAAIRAAEKVADENRVRATYIPSAGFDHRANIDKAANTQGMRGGYQAGRQIDLPSQRVLPAHITPPPMSPGQVYRSSSDASSARSPETTPAVNKALPPTEQNVEAVEGSPEATGVLGKTLNSLGDTANWMLGRDQPTPAEVESGATTSTQRTIDGNPKPRDAGQQAADDINSRTVYVDLAPQAWAKVKAYGRAGIENVGEVLQATGQAMTTKAQQIEAAPEDMAMAHDHLAIAQEQVASVLPGGSENNSGSRAGSQAGSQAGGQAAATGAPKPTTQTAAPNRR